MPKEVDVLIPIYNRQEFLGETLKSIEEQTFKDWRVIMYDDGSTDDSLKIAKEFKKKYPDTKIYIGAKNKGVGFARNVLLSISEAPYLMWQDSDDISSRIRIEKMLECIKVSGADICFSDVNFFEGNSKPSKLRHMRRIDITKYVDRDGLYNNTNFASGIFRSKLKEYLFRDNVNRKEDVFWLSELIKSGIKFGYLPTPVYFIRRHPNRLTYQKYNEGILATGE